MVLQKFTVISIKTKSNAIVADYVEARNGLNAFAIAAARHEEEVMFVATVAGHLREGAELEFPGSALVDSATVREQPEVFGEDVVPGNSPEFPLSDQQYVAKKGCICPFCGSEDTAGESVDIDGGEAVQQSGCNDCGAEWRDVYRIVGYTT